MGFSYYQKSDTGNNLILTVSKESVEFSISGYGTVSDVDMTNMGAYIYTNSLEFIGISHSTGGSDGLITYDSGESLRFGKLFKLNSSLYILGGYSASFKNLGEGAIILGLGSTF